MRTVGSSAANVIAWVASISMLAACARPDPTSSDRAPAEVPSAKASSGAIAAGDTIDVLDDEGRRGTARIDAITADPHDPELTLYEASIRADGSDTWQPYCHPDRDGRNAAFAVSGAWSIDGPRAAEGVTLACTSGSIGKCIRLHYRPWDSLDGGSIADLLTACTRMIRADYCGDGQSHTKDGTWIDVYDRFGIQKREPRPGVPERFEAAWGPRGATYLTVGRWTDDVDSIVKECPDKLKGRVGPALSPDEIARRFPETWLYNDHPERVEDRLMH
jgi:hypothetical protein